MLVTNALDIMSTVSVIEQCRTLHRLQSHNLVIRPDLLQAIACCYGPRRAHGRSEGGNLALAHSFRMQLRRKFHDGVARDVVVESIVAEHLKLVENANTFRVCSLQLLAPVVDFFDVTFATRSGNDSGAIAADDIKPLPAHFLRQDHDAVKVHAAAHVGSAYAVIARRRPHQGVYLWIDLSKQLLLDEHAIRRPYFVAACWKVLGIEHHNWRLDAGQCLGHRIVVDRALRRTPRDVVQIDRVQWIPGAHLKRPAADLGIDPIGVQHLFESRTHRHLTSFNHRDHLCLVSYVFAYEFCQPDITLLTSSMFGSMS